MPKSILPAYCVNQRHLTVNKKYQIRGKKQTKKQPPSRNAYENKVAAVIFIISEPHLDPFRDRKEYHLTSFKVLEHVTAIKDQ